MKREPGTARSFASPAALLLAAICAAGAVSAEPKLSHSVDIDWASGYVSASVGLDIASAGLRLPSGRKEAERLLDAAVPDLVRETVLGIGLDSYRTVADSLDDGTLESGAFEAFLSGGTRRDLAMDRDLAVMSAVYSWKLSDLAGLYVRHSSPRQLASPTRPVPTRAYSGIVIVAQGPFPVRGEHVSAILSPCLFPRVYDVSMTLVLERNLAYPDALKSRGAVAYATALDSLAVAARAGADPLRIVASAVFGSRRTDLVISQEDAQKILGDPANRELVRTGRVVVIIDAP